jgi:hypothetical protein
MTSYDILLDEARTKAATFRATAKEYIPRMYDALRSEDHDMSPEDARDRIQKDCINIWSRRTILDSLPDEAKDPEKQKAGRLRQKKRNCAAFSAAPISEDTKEILIGAHGSSVVEESLIQYTPQFNPGNDEINLSPGFTNDPDQQGRFATEGDDRTLKLLSENKELKKQIVSLEEKCNGYLNTINNLRAAAAKTAFTPASQIYNSDNKEIVLDLNKYGPKMLSLIRNTTSTCILKINNERKVTDIKGGNNGSIPEQTSNTESS